MQLTHVEYDWTRHPADPRAAVVHVRTYLPPGSDHCGRLTYAVEITCRHPQTQVIDRWYVSDQVCVGGGGRGAGSTCCRERTCLSLISRYSCSAAPYSLALTMLTTHYTTLYPLLTTLHYTPPPPPPRWCYP